MHRTKRAEHADHAEYNEIVVALAPYLQGLPHSVAAFFFTEWASEEQRAYVQTARAKGLSEKRVLYGHVFRNAMLIVIAGFPGAFVGILFTGAMLIEIIFSLDGLGLLGFEAAIKRDYPIMFATVYFFTLLGLVMNLIGDLMYTIIDPRIDFEGRHV